MPIACHFEIGNFAFDIDEFQIFIFIKQGFDILVDIANGKYWAILVHYKTSSRIALINLACFSSIYFLASSTATLITMRLSIFSTK